MEFEFENRLVNEHMSEKEGDQEKRLRPLSFKEYVGQKKVMSNIEVMVQSAIKRKASLDHILLSGPPGLGKTSLAMIVANEIGSSLHTISGPAIEKKGDIAAVLTNLNPGDVLFIDEIHRMHISVEEILYSAMEDFRLDIVIGQGPAAKTMEIKLPHFCLIGATTKSGLLSSPLRDRFMAHFHFDFYNQDELFEIIEKNSQKIDVEIEKDAIVEMAKRSRGTPRIANRILRRVRDYAVVKNNGKINLEIASLALKQLEVDENGLDSMDHKILNVIYNYYSGGPVGIEALSATLGEDRGTIEDVYEPYLLKEGFIVRSPRGRMLSEKSTNILSG